MVLSKRAFGRAAAPIALAASMLSAGCTGSSGFITGAAGGGALGYEVAGTTGAIIGGVVGGAIGSAAESYFKDRCVFRQIPNSAQGGYGNGIWLYANLGPDQITTAYCADVSVEDSKFQNMLTATNPQGQQKYSIISLQKFVELQNQLFGGLPGQNVYGGRSDGGTGNVRGLPYTTFGM